MEYPKVEKKMFNVDNENLLKLASLFPSAVKDGQLDIDALKEELGQFEEVGQEKYELNWAGKQNAKKEARKNVLGKTLRYIEGDGVDEDTTQNLYIEGDNLEVLKLLRKNYYGRIKMIYIDPPYNTGNDFVYNDNFSMTQEKLEQLQGERDEYGERLQKNSKDSAKYHTNWLNMMYPRLQLAKDLLKEDGVIFISIDDNEQANLKQLCDSIFGAENFTTTLHIELSATQGMKVKAAKDGNIVKNAEYILIYTKNGKKNIAKNLLYDYRPIYDDHYSKILSKDLELSSLKDEYFKFNPNANIKNLSEMYNEDAQFRNFVKENANSIVADDKITGFDISDYSEPNKVYKVSRDSNEYYIYNNGTKLRQLLLLSDSFGQCDDFNRNYGLRKIRGDWWKEFYKDMGNVSKEGEVVYANGKKPVRLIKQLITMCTEQNDIILDFFSGSATTAHACITANVENSTNRKFIMVQIPEVLSETNSEKKDLAIFLKSINKPTILSELGKERIRRAGQKIKEEWQTRHCEEQSDEAVQKKIGLDCFANARNDNSFTLDIGFKVFRVGETTLNWEKIRLQGKDIVHDYLAGTSDKDKLDFTPDFKNDLNVVYEIMLRQEGLPLTSSIEKLSCIGSRTYLVADSYLISLEETITNDMIEKLSSLNPLPFKFVFRDSAFDDNIVLKDETFRRLNALIDKNTSEEKKTYTVEFI